MRRGTPATSSVRCLGISRTRPLGGAGEKRLPDGFVMLCPKVGVLSLSKQQKRTEQVSSQLRASISGNGWAKCRGEMTNSAQFGRHDFAPLSIRSDTISNSTFAILTHRPVLHPFPLTYFDVSPFWYLVWVWLWVLGLI